MDQPTVPELYCPFPSAVNPYAEVVNEQTVAWADHFHLLPDAGAAQRLRGASVGWLIGRAYPLTARPMLQFLADWSTWLLIWDDMCSAPHLAMQPEKMAQLAKRYCRLLEDGVLTSDDPPLALALLDLRLRILPLTTPAWRTQFISHVGDFFDACRWEATNRSGKIMPDIATYIAMRPFTGGLYTYIALFEVTDQIVLPAAIQAHPIVQRLTQTASTIVCWINDLLSLHKELREGDVHNLVVIIANQYNLPLQAAIYRAVALHDAHVRAFLDLETELPAFGPEVDTNLARYIASLHSWMRGSLDWSYTSGRYLSSTASEASAPHGTTTTTLQY